MKAKSVCVVLAATLSLVAFASLPSLAATSPAMQACSKQWDGMKAAGKTEGKTWPTFWSQCSKNFAAKNSAAAAPEKAAPKKATEKATTARNEDDTAGSAQQKKDCDAKWDANKAKTGAHGWHDYFQFMSKCM
jgi:hypothetical protein